jgi:hypothetical protein
VSPTSASAIKWCGLGEVIAAAYQLTHNTDAAYQVGYQVLRPRYGSATLIHTNDVRGMQRCLRCSIKFLQRDSGPWRKLSGYC